MTSLGNYHHDFPRLAKQSGYFFQLYRGRVNWVEIENLNIDDIVENRNFELLEQNLLNVINCNLDREYDLKILDQKFVKLFKLAQLGVDYLSYCEMYLDRCVVLLQEQLIAFQQECELLKEENQKKTEELRKSKKKTRNQSYQCEKCEKVFISEVYLKYHDKRRHSNPSTPKSSETPVKKCVDTFQQTEEEKTLTTTSTQTFNSKNEASGEQETEEISKIKKESNLKMETLEKELENLKDRLKKAESTLTEKAEASNSNVPSSVNYPAPIFYPPILPFFPPYLPQPPGGYYEFNPGYQMSVPEFRHPVSLPETVNTESVVETKPTPENVLSIEKAEEKNEKIPNDVPVVVNTGNFFTSREKPKKTKKKFERDKENVDPNPRPDVRPTNATKLSPPIPKKRNTLLQTPLPRNRQETQVYSSETRNQEDQTIVEPFTASDASVLPESEFTTFGSQSITCLSTLLKEDTKFGSLEDIKLHETNVSNESLISDEVVTIEPNSKSFFKKVVRRKAPKLQDLGKNLRKSLNVLYDSVSGKNSLNLKESKREDLKNETVDGLNNRLRELGVDPDWSGIPKKTMHQKLKDLKHRRKLLAKEYPMFSIIRQNLEKTIFTSRKSLKNVTNKKPDEEPTTETAEMQNRKLEVKNTVMYDIKTDSETEASDLEEAEVLERPPTFRQKVNFRMNEPEVEDVEKITKQMDLSVFQVSGNIQKSSAVEELRKEISEEKLHLDSDLDDDFLEDFDNEDLKTIASYFDIKEEIVDSKTDGERKDVYENEFFISGKDKGESLSILKNSQSKPQLNSKKKVLFAEDSHELEKNLSDDESEDDDLWFLKSDRKTDTT